MQCTICSEDLNIGRVLTRSRAIASLAVLAVPPQRIEAQPAQHDAGKIPPAPTRDQKIGKDAASYRDTPIDRYKECDTCVLFIPGSNSKTNGTCKIVKGSISPKGWCKFYAPKMKI